MSSFCVIILRDNCLRGILSVVNVIFQTKPLESWITGKNKNCQIVKPRGRWWGRRRAFGTVPLKPLQPYHVDDDSCKAMPVEALFDIYKPKTPKTFQRTLMYLSVARWKDCRLILLFGCSWTIEEGRELQISNQRWLRGQSNRTQTGQQMKTTSCHIGPSERSSLNPTNCFWQSSNWS